MSIAKATTAYEQWLGTFCPLHAADLDYKHARMSEPDDPFPFFRGTYYRWASTWLEFCPEEISTPLVPSVGDLHIENFGTWRDADGRLCWGVNDFDEADELPYTNDLIRLATSTQLARANGGAETKLGAACDAILTGYRETLERGGEPFVLEERHPELRAIALTEEREPVRFWAKLTRVLNDPPVEPSATALDALLQSFPSSELKTEFRFRPCVGMGSLGKPRFVALAEWSGGWVAREAKAVTPPATAWVMNRTDKVSFAAERLARAIRCPDPYYRPGREWVVRRLAPHCARIELGALGSGEVALHLLWAMGAEAANVHLGARDKAASILHDLSQRPRKWLHEAVRTMVEAVLRDWQKWQRVRDEDKPADD